MSIPYAILNTEGLCVNRILWDGESDWQPPEGYTAIPDPDNLHPIYQEPRLESSVDLLDSFTPEQIEKILLLINQKDLTNGGQ